MLDLSQFEENHGPWSCKHIRGSNFAVQTFEIRGMFGDSPHVDPIFNIDDSAIDGTFIHVSPHRAKLITAAPDLLAECRRLQENNRELCEALLRFRGVILTHTQCPQELLDALIAKNQGA